ncbi:MAG: hypothetical protein LUQ09_03560 [Methanomassiliicoccales archaeon]|nr:hypothetical protein [Methanomassiliicoccales archaeon]
MFEKLVKELMKLGLSEYEAKVYSGLLGLGEGTARQVHEASDVPRPRVYDILESLEMKGYVEVWQGYPKSYRAIDPGDLMISLREGLERSIHLATAELNDLSLQAKKRTFPIWHIKGEFGVRNQVRTMIAETNDELLVICTRSSTMRKISKDLVKVAEKAEVRCLLTDGADAFRKAMPGVTIIEPTRFTDPLAKAYFEAYKGKIEKNDERYRPELLMVFDGTRSLLTYQANDEWTVIVFELPLITQLQKSAIVNMMEEGH